jgi:hypothetical protein
VGYDHVRHEQIIAEEMENVRTMLSVIKGLLLCNGMKLLRFKIPYRRGRRFNDVRVLANKSLSCLVGVPELPCELNDRGIVGCGNRGSFWEPIRFGVKE